MEGAEGVEGLRRSFISLGRQGMGKSDVECSDDGWSKTAKDIWLRHGMR